MSFAEEPDRTALAEIAALHARLVYMGRGEMDVAIALFGAACAIFARLNGEAFLAELLRRESRRLYGGVEEARRGQARAWCAANLDRLDARGKA